jgi:hypothetical protein
MAVLQEAHSRVVDSVTDVAGRRAAPAQKNWGAPLGDDHNLELESKRRAIRTIAARIERLIQSTDYPGCWLAAPKEVCHQIVYELAPPIRHRVKRVIPCDLTKVRPTELVEQFLNPSFWILPT